MKFQKYYFSLSLFILRNIKRGKSREKMLFRGKLFLFWKMRNFSVPYRSDLFIFCCNDLSYRARVFSPLFSFSTLTSNNFFLFFSPLAPPKYEKLFRCKRKSIQAKEKNTKNERLSRNFEYTYLSHPRWMERRKKV